MLECLILGDSIAVGTHYYNQIQGKIHCETHSVMGHNSYRWNFDNRNREFKAGVVLISLGTNDHAIINTKKELQSIRKRTKAEAVYWVLPTNNPKAQRAVREVSQEYGDFVLRIKELSKDGVHPTVASYKHLVKKINETRIRQ